MSGATAAIYRLDDVAVSDPPRGLLRSGFAADIVAFSPDEVRDMADFEQPHRPSEGMRAVWVNGQRAWHDETPADTEGHGQALRARW